MGLCPFHNEKSPSFSVSPENGFFHCFGCHAGGDVITFIRRIENLDYVEAVKFLAQRAGMTVPEEGKDNGMGRLRMRIFEANREAARFYHKQLYTPQGKKALEYLRSRGLTEKTIIHFGLGYSPSDRFELVNHLRSKGFTAAEMIQANLANESKKGNPYDRFSDRVMFPILDLRGNVIAFGGRIMSDIKPKYLNTSDTPAFNKSRSLFALQFAKNKANGQLILVEGYMDVIALHQAGIENAVATLGTALTQEQAMLLKRYCDEIVICYDSDNAGQNAAARAISILRPTGLKIKVIAVPNGKDPDEFIRSNGDKGAAKFRMLIEDSGSDIEYRMKKLRDRYNIEVTEQRIDYVDEVCRIIAAIDSAVERDVYISQLAGETGVEKSAVKSQVDDYLHARRRDSKKQQQRTVRNEMSAKNDKINAEKFYNLRAAHAEEAIIALVINNPDAAADVFRRLQPEHFVTAFNRRVYEVLRKRAEAGNDISLADISGAFTADEMSEITSMLVARPREQDIHRAVEEYIAALEQERSRLSPEQMAQAGDAAIKEYLEKKRKQSKNRRN